MSLSPNRKKSEFDVYFRVLETSDEYFDYYRKRHGLWKMYGLNLPDEVLKKVYYKNALKLFPNIKPKPKSQKTTTETPDFAKVIAALKPVNPAPTITTSAFFGIMLLSE